MSRTLLALTPLLLIGMACGGLDTSTPADAGPACNAGEEGCGCLAGNSCASPLQCISGVCEAPITGACMLTASGSSCSCNPACPAGWYCLGEVCARTLAEQPGQAWSLVPHADDLYWIDSGTEDALGNYANDGKIVRMPRAGGPVSDVLTDLVHPSQLGRDGQRLLFVERRGDFGATTLSSLDVTTHQLTVLTTTTSDLLSVTSTQGLTYWVIEPAPRMFEIWNRPIDGSAPAALHSSGEGARTTLIAAADALYWSDTWGPGQFRLAHGETTPRQLSNVRTLSMLLQGDWLIAVAEWVRLEKTPVSGGATVHLAEDQFTIQDSGGPGPFCTLGDRVYWSMGASRGDDRVGTRHVTYIFDTPQTPGATQTIAQVCDLGLHSLVSSHGALYAVLVDYSGAGTSRIIEIAP